MSGYLTLGVGQVATPRGHNGPFQVTRVLHLVCGGENVAIPALKLTQVYAECNKPTGLPQSAKSTGKHRDNEDTRRSQ